jgi:spermidine/putrescine transport system ATP-binding protein
LDGEYIGKCKIIFSDELFKVKDEAVRKFAINSKVKFMIRPEDIRIVKFGRGIINGKITHVIYKGVMNDIRCQWKNREILVQSTSSPKVGDKVGLR